MADHVLAQVSSVYSDFRRAASQAVHKQHLFRTFSKEVEPPTKVVKKAGAEETQPAAAAASDSKDPGPRGISAAGASPVGAVDHAVKATLFIGVYGNSGPKAVLIHFPADKKPCCCQ